MRVARRLRLLRHLLGETKNLWRIRVVGVDSGELLAVEDPRLDGRHQLEIVGPELLERLQLGLGRSERHAVGFDVEVVVVEKSLSVARFPRHRFRRKVTAGVFNLHAGVDLQHVILPHQAADLTKYLGRKLVHRALHKGDSPVCAATQHLLLGCRIRLGCQSAKSALVARLGVVDFGRRQEEGVSLTIHARKGDRLHLLGVTAHHGEPAVNGVSQFLAVIYHTDRHGNDGF